MLALLFFETLAELGDFLRVNLAALDEAHDKLFAGASEHAVDEIANSVRGSFGFSDGGTISEGPAVEFALQLALAVEYVEHGLNGGVGEVLGKGFLNGAYSAGSVTPDDLHNL